jgi:ferredoxin
MLSCFCPFFVQFRLIVAKIGKTKFSIGEGVAFFHFHDTITVQILMEVLPMAYQIGSGCVSCGACADVCPVGAISQGDDHYVIDANSCLDCGTCSDTCPNGAISPAE